MFDDQVTNETKNKNVSALQNDSSGHPPVKTSVDLKFIQIKNLGNFVSNNSKNFFRTLGLEMEFMDNNVDIWNQEESCRKNMKVVKSLKVVNDIVE